MQPRPSLSATLLAVLGAACAMRGAYLIATLAAPPDERTLACGLAALIGGALFGIAGYLEDLLRRLSTPPRESTAQENPPSVLAQRRE